MATRSTLMKEYLKMWTTKMTTMAITIMIAKMIRNIRKATARKMMAGKRSLNAGIPLRETMEK